MLKKVLNVFLISILAIFVTDKVSAKMLTVDEVIEKYNSLMGELSTSIKAVKDEANKKINVSSDSGDIVSLNYGDDYIEYDNRSAVVTKELIQENLFNFDQMFAAGFVPSIFDLSGYGDKTLNDEIDFSNSFDEYGLQIVTEPYSFSESGENGELTMSGDYLKYLKASLDTEKIDKLIEEYGVDGCNYMSVMHYVVRYDVDGGEEITEDAFYDPTKYEFPTPKKEGYTFEGWYKDKDFESKVEDVEDINFVLEEDEDTCTRDHVATLYAKWKKDEKVDVDNTGKSTKSSIILVSLFSLIVGTIVILLGKRKNINKI